MINIFLFRYKKIANWQNETIRRFRVKIYSNFISLHDIMSFILFGCVRCYFRYLISWKVTKISKSQLEWRKIFFCVKHIYIHLCIILNGWRPCKQAYSRILKRKKISGTIIFINISSRASVQLWIIIAFGKWFPCLRN